MPELQDAARRFFREPYNFFASGSSSGFSGSDFARVQARGKSWCLRRWPSSFEKGRLRFIHRVLLHSRANGFAGVPTLATTDEGETVLDLDGRLFDAQAWLAGEPLSGRPVWDEPMPNVVRPLEPRTLASLAAAVARFHRSTARLTPERESEKEPLSTHLAGLVGEAETNHEALLADVGDRAKGDERRVEMRWLELLPEAVALAGATLRDYPAGARRVSTLCHGDLWAAHVYFAGGTFVGIADFESISFGSPALDLAQLILHFNGWSARDAVVDAYGKVSSLGEDEAVLPAAAVADLAWEGYWSLTQLYGGGHRLRPAQEQAHVTNLLRTLLGSLELILGE